MKYWKKDHIVYIFKLTEEMFDIHRQSEDMANFLNLEGKLTTTLKKIIKFVLCYMQSRGHKLL